MVWVRKGLGVVWRALSTYGQLWVVPYMSEPQQSGEQAREAGEQVRASRSPRSTWNRGGLERTGSSSGHG